MGLINLIFKLLQAKSEVFVMSIAIDKKIYANLSSTEKTIIDFIFENQKNILNMSITNIAKKTNVSAPTVSRTIQKCGYNGISELRYKIMTENNMNSGPNRVDNKEYNVNKVIYKIYKECNDTLNNLIITDILKTVDLIRTSRRVFLCARGATGLIAEEFLKYLLWMGIDAILATDSLWLKHIENMATKNDLIIILTVTGDNESLVQAALKSNKNSIPVVTLTCNEDSKLKFYSDIILFGHYEKITNYRSMDNNSRLPLMILTRIIAENMQ